MFKKAVIGIGLNALALYGVTYFLPEITYTGGIKFFLIAGVILGMLNVAVKPIFKIVTFPLIFLTGGVFLAVINVILLAFTKYVIRVIHFQDVTFGIAGAGNFLMAGLLFGVINWGAHLVVKNK